MSVAVFLLLVGSGAMCPHCGWGTRATSKNWARCKKCGERVKRLPMETVADALNRGMAAFRIASSASPSVTNPTDGEDR